MKIRFSPRASISIALVEVGNFARKKDEWKKKREEGRNEGGKRVGGRKKREEEGTAAFHNLISTSSSLVDPGTSLYRRSNATPPPTFRLNSFSKCERGRGRYRAVFELSRAASRYYRSIEFLKMKGCFVSRLIGKGRGGLFIGLGLCIRFGILTDFLARFLIFRLYLLPIFFKR